MRERTQSASTEDVPAAASPAPTPKVELRNSLWCVHTANGRVGMINEFHAGAALFHYADAEGVLETAAVAVPQEELRIAKAAELPAHLGFTEQQCKDTGYL